MPTPYTTAHMPSQHGRSALVTGANTGIGFHQALELARSGAHMLLASRGADRGRAARAAIAAELPAASVELVQLDLADLESVRLLEDRAPARHAATGTASCGISRMRWCI